MVGGIVRVLASTTRTAAATRGRKTIAKGWNGGKGGRKGTGLDWAVFEGSRMHAKLKKWEV